METTFRLSCDKRVPVVAVQLCAAFQELSEMICRECGGGCQGFRLLEDMAAYERFTGPKLGWVVEGETVLLRMANCSFVDKRDRIAPMLELFGLSVIDSRLVQ